MKNALALFCIACCVVAAILQFVRESKATPVEDIFAGGQTKMVRLVLPGEGFIGSPPSPRAKPDICPARDLEDFETRLLKVTVVASREHSRGRRAVLRIDEVDEQGDVLVKGLYCAYVDMLPFIKEAQVDEDDPGILHVTTYRGETANIRLDVPRRKARTDNKSRFEEAESFRGFLDRGLQRGACYFLFSRSGYTTLGDAKRDLPNLVRALQSADAVDGKIANLKAAGFRWTGECPFLKVVTTFSASQSSQLQQRLKNIVETEPTEKPK